eukprot:15353-Heterococcus_DN1.PRE.2
MQQTNIFDRKYIQKVACTAQMTLYSSVFASTSRVKLAHENGVGIAPRWTSLHPAAGKYATVATLELARELGMTYSLYTMIGAAESNQLPVVQFLHEQGCAWSDEASTAAAGRGDIEMLHWMLEHGCEWESCDIACSAARSGSFDMCVWVNEHLDVQFGEDAMAAAAEEGHAPLIEFMHAEQCPCDERACTGAARFGHLVTLRWLHEHGCPWHAHAVCEAAGEGGSVDMIIYLRQQGIVFTPELLTDMLNAAGAYNHLTAAHWLRQQGAEWPPVLKQHILKRFYAVWDGETLAWARAEGCTSPTE